MLQTAIGIDIGGTNLRAARISRSGQVDARIVETITRDPEAVFARIAALCAVLGESGNLPVGIGVPGRVDARRRMVLSGGYVNLGSIRIVERLEQVLATSVTIDNDCNMALTAEMTNGAARDADNVVMLTIGTGIGGAASLDGRIVRGRATAGQLGHVTVVHDGAPCACDRRGCVETTSSGTALGFLIAQAGLPAETRIDDLFQAAAAGQSVAAGVLDHWASPLRDAIDSLVAAFDPDLVLLGGGLGSAAHRALLRTPALSQWFQCEVLPAQLGEDAGLIGAGLSALAAPKQAFTPPRTAPAAQPAA